MALIHKDKSTVLRCEAADVLQGRNVAVHREGPIGGYQAEPMLLQEGYKEVVGRWGQSTVPLCV